MPLTTTAPAVTIPRRVPAPVLRPPLDLCKPTGVSLGPGSRVVVAFDQGGVGKALAGRLTRMGVEVLDLDELPGADALVALVQAWRSAGPVQGVYWLPALDREMEIGAMSLADWHEALRRRVKLFSHVLRALGDDLARPGGFVMAATRLGGRHGYDETGAVAPLGGAVTGLAKAFQREQPTTLVKAVDFTPGGQTAAVADHLIEETLRDPGAVEIGWENGRRWTIGLSEEPLATGSTGGGLTLNPDSVFVVTGAAGSIVSAILQDLTAAARGGVFHLLDLAPEPDPADPDLARLAGDREGLKRDLFERIKARGERATPALVEKELARLERGRAALDALLAIQAAGGKAVWHRLDLRDGDAVRQAIEQVRNENGRIDVLLHAGGLEISRRLADKKPEEYDLVFDVKVDGWFHLLSAIGGSGDMPLGAAVVFSSIAGRFGNQGQTDYSAANDLLCKQVAAFRHTRPGTLGIALDWTAWGGIGMATRGSIPAIMEAAGIDMLPPEIGVPWVRQELAAGTRGEVVVAGRLGAMLEERDRTGGLDVAEEVLDRLRGRGGIMVGRLAGMGVWSGLEIETTLDPAEQPFLDHHRIDGTPVLPGVMGVEAFAEAASFLFPDLAVLGVEDVEFLAPFKFYRNEPRTVTIRVQLRPDGDAWDRIVADCRLVGRRTLPGQTEPQVTEHFRARVRLAPETQLAEDGAGPAVHGPEDRPAVGAGDIYKVYFHGPAYQVMDEAWKDGDQVAGRMARELPPNHCPEAAPTVMEPRLIELCFQTAGIGELGASGRMALPLRVDRVRTLRHPNGEPLFAVARHQDGEGSVDAWVVDGKGNVYVTLSGYRTIELPGGVAPETLAPLQNAMG